MLPITPTTQIHLPGTAPGIFELSAQRLTFRLQVIGGREENRTPDGITRSCFQDSFLVRAGPLPFGV